MTDEKKWEQLLESLIYNLSGVIKNANNALLRAFAMYTDGYKFRQLPGGSDVGRYIKKLAEECELAQKRWKELEKQ